MKNPPVIGRTPRRQGLSNGQLILVIVVLGLVCWLVASRSQVDIFRFISIKSHVPPTGDPIRVTLKAKLQPAGRITQTSETITIEFKHATFPDKVGSMTLRLNKDASETESSLTLPCAAGYDYEIQSKSDLTVDGKPIVVSGTARGTLHFKGGEVVSYAIDPANLVEFFNRNPKQRGGVPSYRPYFDVSEQKQ